MAEIRSDETPSIFNFKKGEIMKHPSKQVSTELSAKKMEKEKNDTVTPSYYTEIIAKLQKS